MEDAGTASLGCDVDFRTDILFVAKCESFAFRNWVRLC